MQSALEHELGLLLDRSRRWLGERDRAVVIGVLLCCVPFLPITFIGLLVTLANLLLVALRRLPRSDMPLLVCAVLLAAAYGAAWWLLFRTLRNSAPWLWPMTWLPWPFSMWLHGGMPTPSQHVQAV